MEQFVGMDYKGDELNGPFIKGTFETIGTIDGLVFITEDHETGTVVNQVTGEGVVVAFRADNLMSAAKALRSQYPDLEIFICAVNDQWTHGSPRLNQAKEVAATVDGKCIAPIFSDISTKPKDFKDLFKLEGGNAVYDQISAVVFDCANDSSGSPENINRNAPPLASLATIAAYSTHKTVDSIWPEPPPLIRISTSPEPFPVSALPPAMQNAAQKMHTVIQAPDAIIAQSLLAAATLAAQPHGDFLIDGRRKPLSCFFVTIGESGERKSACDEIAGKIIKEKQRQLCLEYSLRRIESETVSDDKFTHMIITEDPTYPALIKSLRVGQQSMGLFTDEGGRFLGGLAMSKDNLANTITGLSKLWDGSPIISSRSGEGNHIVYGRRFSMHIMIQPVIANRLFSDPIMANQGFLSRCLCSFPYSTIGDRAYVEYDLSGDPDILNYHMSITDLVERPYPHHRIDEMGLDPNQLTLEGKAKSNWILYHDHVETLQQEGKKLHTIKGFASKAAEHCLRLSGVVAVFENPDCINITPNQLDAGIEITNYYLGEALRLFETCRDNPELLMAQKVLCWAQQHGNLLPLADLYQYGPNAVRDKATAIKMIKILEDAGWARKSPGRINIYGRTRRDVWQVWPGRSPEQTTES